MSLTDIDLDILERTLKHHEERDRCICPICNYMIRRNKTDVCIGCQASYVCLKYVARGGDKKYVITQLRRAITIKKKLERGE